MLKLDNDIVQYTKWSNITEGNYGKPDNWICIGEHKWLRDITTKNILKQKKADIIFLQEIHLREQDAISIGTPWIGGSQQNSFAQNKTPFKILDNLYNIWHQGGFLTVLIYTERTVQF